MDFILIKTLESISFLKHFYETQKDYINRKSKTGMKENQTGFLLDVYLNVLVHGSDEEKERSTFKNLETFAKKHIEIIETKDATVTFSTKTKIESVSDTSKKYRKFQAMPAIHIDNTVVMLITRFEEFIADYIRYIFIKYPQKYLDKQTICFSEITETNYTDIKEKILNREIDEIMRKSYTVWFDLFKEHKMNVDCCSCEYDFLTELYATRNIIVHNRGIVNEQYLKNVKTSKYVLGEKIYIDNSYILKAFECIKTIILCIYIEGIRLDKQNADKHIQLAFNSAFDELSMKNFNTSKTVFYSLYKSDFSDEITRYMSKVNCWIAQIELNGLSEVKTEIENFDVSALNISFLLAKNILLLKFKEATNVIEEMYQKKELTSLEIEKWPLFFKYRESEEYNKFKLEHPELMNVGTVETDSEETIANNETTKNVKSELKDINDTDTD